MKAKTYSAHVAIGGDIGNTVVRKGNTAAEVIMMSTQHTKSGVFEIIEDGEINISQEGIRERLNTHFTPERVIEAFGPFGELPTDIAAGNFDEAQFAEPKKPVGRPKKAPAKIVKKEEVKEEEKVE